MQGASYASFPMTARFEHQVSRSHAQSPCFKSGIDVLADIYYSSRINQGVESAMSRSNSGNSWAGAQTATPRCEVLPCSLVGPRGTARYMRMWIEAMLDTVRKLAQSAI